MINLSVKVCDINFKNPIIMASGTFGFGREYAQFFDLSYLGGISVKGLTLEPKEGNDPIRICETSSGMLNSVGLQNPGVEKFIENELDFLKEKDTVIIANLAGKTIDEYVIATRLLDNSDVDMIELNISCPNVKKGGVQFGVSCENVYNITSKVKQNTSKPLIVKLSPNVTDISVIAKSVEDAGADAISLVNTFKGMRIDIDTKRPVLKNNIGGLSGPCIFPIALRMVYEVCKNVSIPVIGMGGISCASDAIEMIIAGATCVQIGTAIFNDPMIPIKIINDIYSYLKDNNINDINELRNTIEIW